MKKIFYAAFASFVFILMFASHSANAQLSLSVGPSIGLTLPTVDYSGETTDFYAGTKYGLRSGLNYGAVAKLTFGPLNGKLGISYATLENTGQGTVDVPGSTLDIKNNIFMISLGTEFGFSVPLSPIRPYAGIDILFSTISGSYKFTGVGGLNANENSIQSSSRTGLGLNLGAEIKLGISTRLDLSLHYNLLNLFGKDYKNGTTRLDAYSSVNDAQDPQYSAGNPNHPIGNSRTIATIQLQVAFLFGF